MLFFRQLLLIGCFFLGNTDTVIATDNVSQLSDDKTSIANPLSVTLDEEIQQQAGILTIAVTARVHRPEFLAYGEVLDITPLLALRQQYLMTTSRHASAAAKSRLSQQSMSRLEDLYRHDIVSTRRVQEQQTQLQTDRSLADETAAQRRMIIATSRQQWGDTLTDWFIQPSSPEADHIIQHRAQLLQITLSTGTRLPEGADTIEIALDGKKENSWTAQLISVAPNVALVNQGKQYFFLVEKAHLPAGLRVVAWIPQQSADSTGVIIPRSALLWHLGQTLVFIKTGEEQFSRRIIDHYYEVTDGYFVSDQIKPSEAVVKRGAQLLLSQLMRGQIPDEDDDE